LSNKLWKIIINSLLGFTVGVTALIPGISGGTIIFISGKYQIIISTVFNLFYKLIRNNKQSYYKHDYSLLLNLIISALTTILIFSNLLSSLMVKNGKEVESIFLGLILIFCIKLLIEAKLNFRLAILFLLGLIVGLSIFFIPITKSVSPNNTLVLFSGIIAGGAMILPGISGAAILLIIGMYETTLNGISTLGANFLTFFLSGAIIGAFLGLYLLKFLIDKYSNQFIIFTTGFILGSMIELILRSANEVSLSYKFLPFLLLGIILALIINRLITRIS
tara:strand:+ start:544 stop:1374 length:831 start_codon:yes stop_codon:yes gene_type:complete